MIHRPDFTNAEPAVSIGPFPQWHDSRKIVAMDPWGHQAPWLFKGIIEKENGRFLSGACRSRPSMANEVL